MTSGPLDALIPLLKAAVEKALEDTAIAAQAKAREIVPKDTQALMNSIQVEKLEEMHYKISANTDYAEAVHEGRITSKGNFVQGTPYLTAPLLQEKSNIERRIKENL